LSQKNAENKALQEELANGQKQVEALKPKTYDLEQMMKHMHGPNQAAMMQQLPEQQPSALEQQFATIATNDNNEEEDGNLIELSACLYVENEEVRNHILQQLHDLKQSARIVVKSVDCPPDCKPMDMIPAEIASTQTYDNGVYLAVGCLHELGTCCYLADDEVRGARMDKGAGIRGHTRGQLQQAAHLQNWRRSCWSSSGEKSDRHLPRRLWARPSVKRPDRRASSHAHEGQATWINVDDKRLLSPGPKSVFVEITLAQIDGTTKNLSALAVNLGSENSTGNTVEKKLRKLVVRKIGLASLNGQHPIALELPEDAPGLRAQMRSTAVNEMIGDKTQSVESTAKSASANL
jgi:hypothetical protein